MVVDFYNLNYKMYEDLRSVCFVDDKLLFIKSIEELMGQKVSFEYDWSLLSRTKVFDGNVLSRYYKMINDSKHLNKL